MGHTYTQIHLHVIFSTKERRRWLTSGIRARLCPYMARIAGQAEHHWRRTFEEEFVEFLNRHEIAYDPRYVFD